MEQYVMPWSVGDNYTSLYRDMYQDSIVNLSAGGITPLHICREYRLHK
jgi:hypothetical protein